MTKETFKIECQRTCPTLGDVRLDLSHMVLGMNSELVELEGALDNKDSTNVGEELADFQWYLYNYLTMRKISPFETIAATIRKEFNNSKEIVAYLYSNTSLLQDIIKKYIAYGKEIKTVDENELLGNLMYGIYEMYRFNNLNEGEWLDKNIAKLRKRFPDKFDADMAINRDVLSERQILEGKV